MVNNIVDSSLYFKSCKSDIEKSVLWFFIPLLFLALNDNLKTDKSSSSGLALKIMNSPLKIVIYALVCDRLI